jgi:hypothetical protein
MLTQNPLPSSRSNDTFVKNSDMIKNLELEQDDTSVGFRDVKAIIML